MKLLISIFLFISLSTLYAEPKLVFEKEVFDFGEIIEGEKTTCIFHFRNKGDTILNILDVRAPCGCTVTNINKKSLNPGEAGIIKAVFNSRGRKGKISKYIYVTTNEKESSTTRLSIVGIVRKTWNVDPDKVDFGEIKDWYTLIDTVIISSTLVDSIEIDSFTTESNPDGLTAKILSHKGDSVSIEVCVDASKITWKFIGVIRFYSNIDKKRKIIIPVYARIKEEKKKEE
jgi:hypothetical protein